MTMTNSVQMNAKAISVALLVGAGIIYLVFQWTQSTSDRKEASSSGALTLHGTWKTGPLTEIPRSVNEARSSVKIMERRLSFEFNGEKVEDLLLREADVTGGKAKFAVLMLHGAAFTSKTWLDLGTITYIAAFGYKVVAIDLPGWGSSKTAKVKDKAGFLAAFISHEKLDRPVVVSPSMSGSWSVPFLLGDKPQTCDLRARGYVPVAPASTDEYTQAQWHRCEIPAMIVYGTKDTGIGLTSLNNLRNMPGSEIFPLEGAKHPAYLDKPEEWHKLLYNFLKAVERESHSEDIL